MKDRFTRGFTAGVLAGIITSVWNLLSYHLLHMSNLRFLDFAAVFIFGNTAMTIWEMLLSLVGTIIFFGFLGSVFIYLITLITSENLIFKSFLFGIAVWFVSYAISILFKLPELEKVTFLTALSNFFGSSIYGICLGFSLKILDKYKTV